VSSWRVYLSPSSSVLLGFSSLGLTKGRRLRRGIVLEEFFEGPASVFGIVVAVGLSFVIPLVFAACPRQRVRFGDILALDAGSSRDFPEK
jgi:hypothetical protein